MKNLRKPVLIAMVLAMGLVFCPSAWSAIDPNCFHGISLQKNATSPVLVGTPYQAAYFIGNFEPAQDTLHVTSLIDTVHASGGDVSSTNILSTLTWHFTNGAHFIGTNHLELPPNGTATSDPFSFYTTTANDFFLANHILKDDVGILWHDNCDSVTHTCTNCNTDPNQVASAPGQATVTAPLPCIQVDKSVKCNVSTPGSVVTYHITIHNCGPDTLTKTSVTDTLLGNLTSLACTTLDPNTSCSFDVDYTVKQGDPNNLVNKVTVVYHDQFSQTVDANDSVSVIIVHPNFTAAKNCLTEPIPENGPASFSVVIHNTGDIALDFTTSEPTVPEPFQLAAGATKTFDVNVPFDGNDITNTITVDANLPNELCLQLANPIEKKASDTCHAAPQIKVTKTPDCNVSMVGKVVTYTITIKNTGVDPLTKVDVNDSILGDLNSQASGCTPLAAGQSCSFTVTHTITANDPNPLVNKVTAVYQNAFGEQTSSFATASVTIIHPSFTVTKTCTSEPIPAGGPATFDVTVHNTGDVPLSFKTNEPNQSSLAEPFTVAAGATQNLTISIPTSGTLDVLNSITVTASLVGEPPCIQFDTNNQKTASDVCHAPQGGITRTWGFWAQHCDFTSRVFKCCGSSIDLGWVKITSTSQLFGVFRSHDDKKGCPAQSALCKARIQASVQALAAILNGCMKNGAPLPIDEATIAATLKGCDIKAINDLEAFLDAFNNSNDTGTALDCNGKAQDKADGGCAKRLGNCSALGTLCNKTCP